MDWTVSEPMLLPLMNCEADFVMWAQSVSQKTLRTEAFSKTRNNSIGPRPRRVAAAAPSRPLPPARSTASLDPTLRRGFSPEPPRGLDQGASSACSDQMAAVAS